LEQEVQSHALCFDFNELADSSRRCLVLAGTDLRLDEPFSPSSEMDMMRGKIYNLALGKKASQSSTSHFRLADAEKAIDGYIDPVWKEGDIAGNSVSRTLVENAAWWEVDLQETCAITNIHVHRASELEMESASLILQIYNLDDWGDGIPLEDSNVNVNTNGSVTTVTLDQQGSKIRIKRDPNSDGFLALAEVLVMGNVVNTNDDKTIIEFPLGNMLYQDVSFGFPIWDGIKYDLALSHNLVSSLEYKTMTLEESHVITDVIISSEDNSPDEETFTLSITHEVDGAPFEISQTSLPDLVHFVLPPNLLGIRVRVTTSYSYPNEPTIHVVGSALSAETLNVAHGTQPELNYISIIQTDTDETNDGLSKFQAIVLSESFGTGAADDAMVRLFSTFFNFFRRRSNLFSDFVIYK
jgi:hypothetical protein